MTDDRIPCLNPRCRRTAPADRYAPATEILCYKCWRTLPRAMRDGLRRLERRARKVERLIRKREAQGSIPPYVARRVRRRLRNRHHDRWDRIRHYFQAPEKPAGLDAFLEEIGLSDGPNG